MGVGESRWDRKNNPYGHDLVTDSRVRVQSTLLESGKKEEEPGEPVYPASSQTRRPHWQQIEGKLCQVNEDNMLWS
ncbi:hypothetical protein JZ751_022536, partial [Albula glossodonta]